MQNGIANKVDRASKFIEIDGVNMHYLEMGTGRPILFLHSIPMSSSIWRGMFAHLSTMGRCIALDLIGCGRSGAPAHCHFTIFDHLHYVQRFIDTLQLKRYVLVLHGFGSLIGFDIAMRNEANCSGLVFYESFIRPVTPDDLSLPYQEHLSALQHESAVSPSRLNIALFMQHLFQQLTLGEAPQDQLLENIETYESAISIDPILEYLRELPSGNGMNQGDHMIGKYYKALSQSSIPKLMFYSLPGFITSIATVMWAKEHIKRIEVMELGEELHLGHVTYSVQMAEMISIWLQGIEQYGG